MKTFMFYVKDEIKTQLSFHAAGCNANIYVLASEAKEQDDWNVKKRKELELKQIKDAERIKVLEDAMLSIAKNTCCWSCQEAAKVAMKALDGQVFSKQDTLAALEVKP